MIDTHAKQRMAGGERKHPQARVPYFPGGLEMMHDGGGGVEGDRRFGLQVAHIPDSQATADLSS